MALSLVLACGGCTAWPSARSAPDVVLVADPSAGFILLAVRPVSYVKPGRLFAADDAETLRHLWRDLEIPGPVPEADFASQTVVLFADYDTCHGGNGGAELQRLTLSADGRVEPAFAYPATYACEQSWVRFVPTVLYAVAVRRDRLPRDRRLVLAPARVRWLKEVPATEEVKATCTVQARPPSVPGVDSAAPGADSVLAVPPPGVTSQQELADGTPVFVVRHRDGALDVFASDAPNWLDVMQHPSYPVRGLRDAVRWGCRTRRFSSGVGVYDEYGVPVSALQWRSLDRYRTVAAGDGSVLVPFAGRERGYGPRRLSSPPDAVVVGPVLHPYAGFPELTVADALTQPPGSLVVVKGDLVLEPRSAAFLCDGLRGVDEWPECAGARAVAEGVGWSRESRWLIRGPFAARVTGRGTGRALTDVTLLNVPYFVPAWESIDRTHDWRTLKVEGTLSTIGVAGSSGAAIGAEASLSARTTPWPLGSLLRVLVSEDVGLALRARWLASTGSARFESRFGVAAVFEDSSVYRDWSYPSVLGLVWPEAGVGIREGAVFPYVSWSLPVEYRLESPDLRRHPFAARDVLGVRVAPMAMVSFPPSAAEVLVGLSLGLSLW
jgi:hypothetical protein